MTWPKTKPSILPPFFDVAWEQIADGERTSCTLGTINLPDQPNDMNNPDQQEVNRLRQAAVLDEHRTSQTDNRSN